MTRPRPFEGVFGNTCELRLLEFLLALDDMKFNITELSEEAEVSRVTVGRVVRKFVEWDILVATNERIPQYSINPASSIVQSLEIVNNSLIGQMLGDEKVREMRDYVGARIPTNHHTETDTQKEQVWPQATALFDPEERKHKNMLNLKPQYIVSDENGPVSVILDIETFQKIEAVYEGYGLATFMDDADKDEPLCLSEACEYYANLKKSP